MMACLLFLVSSVLGVGILQGACFKFVEFSSSAWNISAASGLTNVATSSRHFI